MQCPDKPFPPLHDICQGVIRTLIKSPSPIDGEIEDIRTKLPYHLAIPVIKTARVSVKRTSRKVVWFLRYKHIMTMYSRLRHACIILVFMSIGLAELYYLPRYGIEYFLCGIGATAFMAGLWMRAYWDD